MSLREIKAKARAALHEQMKVRAFYYPAGTDALTHPNPAVVHVRVHTEFKALADLKGTNFSYAEDRNAVPRLIFWRAECDPDLGAVIMISEEEGYRIETLDPPDNHTRTGFVEALRASDLAQYSYPGAA